MSSLTEDEINLIVSKVLTKISGHCLSNCPNKGGDDEDEQCTANYCQERCGVTPLSHGEHHKAVKRIVEKWDDLVLKYNHLDKMIKSRDKANSIIGETLIKMIIYAIVAGVASGLVFYLMSRMVEFKNTVESHKVEYHSTKPNYYVS